MLFCDLDLSKTYSYADYYKWTFEDRVELIDGKVYKMIHGANRLHQEVCGHFYNSLRNFVEDKGFKVYFAPFDVRLPKKGLHDKSIFTVLLPDISLICDLSKLDKRGCIGATDIVVEVLSMGDNSKELNKKYDVYEEAGVKEYWIVSPQNQFVTIHILDQSGKFQPSRAMSIGDIISSSVLPGFSLDITELFKDIVVDEY